MTVEGMNALLIEQSKDDIYLFIHGKCGCKEEAYDFAKLTDASVVSIDLPGHGLRKDELANFDPMHCCPLILELYSWAKARYRRVGLRANSIGSYFSLIALEDKELFNCLLVSPLLNMVGLIEFMMRSLDIDKKELEQRSIIPTPYGNDLNWEYYLYSLSHTIDRWQSPTSILYADHDNTVPFEDVQSFASRFNSKLTIAEDCEHWFHTPSQIAKLESWTRQSL